MFGLPRYNYEEFRRSRLLRDIAKGSSTAPRPGEQAPDFELRTLDGDKIRLDELRQNSNVVLIFGSATCPLTVASVRPLQALAGRFASRGVEFLLVYVREAHPGERLRAHRSLAEKVKAAELLRREEKITFPILIDELNGKVHRQYGSLPNPTYIVDRSGRIAFRSLFTRPDAVRDALEELLERQQERNVDHAVVRGGEDRRWPALRSLLYSQRALERGGERAISEFRRELGVPGEIALVSSRLASPILEHPGATAATIAAVAGVLGLGLWVGAVLRRRRFEHLPYSAYDFMTREPLREGTSGYEAFGI